MDDILRASNGEDNRLFKVRCWNTMTNQVEVWSFTLWEIAVKAQMEHMNMVDVGIILLNEERRKLGLDPLPPECIAGQDVNHLKG